MNKVFSLLMKIKIHPLFWLLMGIAFVTAHFKEFLILFSIVFIHEMGHAVCAHFFSWRINKIMLLPFGGVLETDEHGNRPLKQETIVILGGPFMHILMYTVMSILFTFGFIEQEIYETFFIHNLVIALINLLPIWPLDGGKLLFVGLSTLFSFRQPHKYTLLFSSALIVSSVVVLLLIEPLHLNSWIIISFLTFSTFMEWKQRQFVFMRFLLQRFYGKKDHIGSLKTIVVDEHIPVYKVLAEFQRGFKHSILINKNGKASNTLDENELLYAFFVEKNTHHKIGDLIHTY